MGLQKEIKAFGVTFPNGYHKITALTSTKNAVYVSVNMYADVNNKEQAILQKTHQLDYSNDGGSYTWAYGLLKLTEDYTDSLDV